MADRQTHRLPEDEEGIARIASFLGYADTAGFAEEFAYHLRRVEQHYGRMFEAEPTLAADTVQGDLVFTGVEDDPATIATLRAMGYANPGSIAATVRGLPTRTTSSVTLVPGAIAPMIGGRSLES